MKVVDSSNITATSVARRSTVPLTFNWRRPFASAYFRSASSYLGLKLAIFTLAGLATQYLLTHRLDREGYGLLVWAGTIIALLSPFGFPGISTSITGAVAKGYEGNFRRGTWLEMAGGTVGGFVLLGFAVYYWLWTQHEIKALVFLLAGVMGPGLWLDTHQCYWNGKKNFKALFWWAVPVRLAQLLVTAIVLYFSSSPVLVFGVTTSIQVVSNISAAVGIMKIAVVNKNISKEYQSFGWFSTSLYWIGTVAAFLDKIIIGTFFGIESLAVFAVGQLLYSYLYKTPASFLSQIFLPRLAEMEITEAARWIKNRQKYLVAVIFLIVVVIGIATPIVYPLLFSVKYEGSIFYAYLFLGCIVLGSPTLLTGTLLKAHAMKRETFVGWSILCFTPIISMPMFGYYLGIKGIILARALTNATVSGYYLWLLNHLTKDRR
jgi:O-antigen/teichoic acid export membrane protein